MPESVLTRLFLLPELKLLRLKKVGCSQYEAWAVKESAFEVCPKCAHKSSSIYDHRQVRIKDAPVRGNHVLLIIRKRRFYCRNCKSVFTEPVNGIRKGAKTSEPFRKNILWACSRFKNLKEVKVAHRCSYGTIYKHFYNQLELHRRQYQYPWPSKIGIDEHSFKRNKRYGHMEFASMIVDHKNARLFDVVEGKTGAALEHCLKHIPGRENVQYATLDLCDPYKKFVREFFPNAKIVADKFHVLRLLTPSLLRKRKEFTGTRADARAKKLLTMSSKELGYRQRHALKTFLENHSELAEIYYWKEQMHRLYRTRGYHKAARALQNMIDRMSYSLLPEIRTLRKTMMRWREEILNYWLCRLTNARTEAMNNIAKLVKRNAYGYKALP